MVPFSIGLDFLKFLHDCQVVFMVEFYMHFENSFFLIFFLLLDAIKKRFFNFHFYVLAVSV